MDSGVATICALEAAEAWAVRSMRPVGLELVLRVVRVGAVIVSWWRKPRSAYRTSEAREPKSVCAKKERCYSRGLASEGWPSG